MLKVMYKSDLQEWHLPDCSPPEACECSSTSRPKCCSGIDDEYRLMTCDEIINGSVSDLHLSFASSFWRSPPLASFKGLFNMKGSCAEVFCIALMPFVPSTTQLWLDTHQISLVSAGQLIHTGSNLGQLIHTGSNFGQLIHTGFNLCRLDSWYILDLT